MSRQHCPECGAAGAGCGCVPGVGFNPLRIRPYVTLPDPGEPDTQVSPQPVSGAVAPNPHQAPAPVPVSGQDDTPAYGIPVPPLDVPWPAGPQHAPHPAETVQLRTIPAADHTPGGGWGGGGGGPERRTGPTSRKPLALLLGAAAAVALSGTAVAVWALPSSSGSDAALVEAKPPAPVSSAAPAAPSASPSPRRTGPSASASPSPSASKSASPSPSASRTTAPASPSPTPSASRASSPPPTHAPTLRYGDTGPEVEKLQRLLSAQGLYRGKINGRFDWRVEDALSEFQYDMGIDHQEWGFYGPITRKALEG